ncbi:MAG: 3-deoxy-manno-octulosonate-8-phosphatase KdsC [Porticoccus sp.]|jgi:3-deoxy-D-manno-octulosonate 8-phosphate phosphatase (KDO 8-P phosphatase)|uniref:3-deoxy-manno-octulosonate-8-phosphatase KdsC n=1 Tax=Porticoccus sp. Uisw_050_02 TaxID=3230978 RepID=UPI001D85A98F|nr:3-deoxy-manno-octulosonate-8-phosphatase KdsC [Porticoccus sp.]|tara:strand:- start:2281 stop:2826 length:546 start_codon:yes stop_codon:yes gene_type:complete
MATSNQKILSRAKSIRLLLLDVDGVLTDGRLYFGNNGEELKAFNIQDGLGIRLLQRSGIEVGIITGRSSALVARRAEELGIKLVIQGREDKLAALEEVLRDDKENHSYKMQEIAFLGDDLPDLAVISRVGLGVAVADAHNFVAKHSHWQTSEKGGCGAVRELAELILQAQNTLDSILLDYL